MNDVPESPPATDRGRGLYRLLLGLSAFGVVLPLVTLVLKASAADFELWTSWRDKNPALGELVADWPVLDLERYPWLAEVSWHQPHQTAYLSVYLTHGALNAGVLVLLLLFRRRVKGWLAPAAAWFAGREHRYPRRVVFAFSVGVLFCYQAQTSLGFYFPGIGGWTYRDWGGSLRPELDPDLAEGRVPTAEERAFLEQAVIFENAKYVPGAGYLTGRAFFLHYADGSVLPGSYELTDMVFPHYYFGGKHVRVEDPATFAKVVRNALEYRRRGGRFLVPLAWSYPNHAVYQPIDYSDYPDPDTLERVSFWHLTVRVDEDGEAELVSALNHDETELPSDG